MLLHQGRRPFPFGQPNWLYELKYDGWRLLRRRRQGRMVQNTRNGADATKWFPEIVEALSTPAGGPHVIDGAICVLDNIGRSSFDRLRDRAHRRRWYTGCDAVVSAPSTSSRWMAAARSASPSSADRAHMTNGEPRRNDRFRPSSTVVITPNAPDQRVDSSKMPAWGDSLPHLKMPAGSLPGWSGRWRCAGR